MYRALIASILLLPFSLVGMSVAEAANAFPQVERSLALVGTPDPSDSGTLRSFGTAFCVTSNATASYFITNNHVVSDRQGRVQRLVIVLENDLLNKDARWYPATVVRRSQNPDLAIVKVDVPNVPAVHISSDLPQVGDDIAIAGFPYNEAVLWGGVFGRDEMAANRPELEPSEHKGGVSAIHGGSYYIQYDAVTDHGNSGGPLFDPATGAVYGVVQASLSGAPEQGSDESIIRNNLAISIREGWTFIARDPVVPDAGAVADASRQQFAHSACFSLTRAFDRAYGEWAYARARHLSSASRALAQMKASAHTAAEKRMVAIAAGRPQDTGAIVNAARALDRSCS